MRTPGTVEILAGRLLGLLLPAVAGILVSALPASAQPRTDLVLTLVPNVYVVDVQAGQDNRFVLEVRNIGATDVTGIMLSSDGPEGWSVEFRPDRIDSLSRGSARTVDVSIRPPSTATRGEHAITFFATASDVRGIQSVQARVEAASYWLWILGGVVVAVLAAFAIVFVRLGRRG